MSINKKMLLGLGGAIVLTTPILAVVSCGTKSVKYTTTDISGLNAVFGEENDKLTEAANAVRTGADEQAKQLLSQKTVLITTGGKVNDKSFNQSVWEAVSKFSREAGLNSNSYTEVSKLGDQASSSSAYEKALRDGHKIWILTGYQQEETLVTWLKTGTNKSRFKDAGIKVITVDWYTSFEDDEALKDLQGRILGLNFKTQESSFVIGYAASKFLGTYFSGSENESKRLLNTFAGGDFSGATNFNYGFYEGMRQWNADNSSDNDKKVFSTVMSENAPVTLNTGFETTTAATDLVKANVEKNAQIMMPVAGPLTGTTLDQIVARKTSQWVVGVDTDMSLSYPAQKDYLITSSEKKIGVAIYKALIQMYGLAEEYNSGEFVSFLGDHKVNEDGIIVNSSSTASNYNVIGGYAEDFVATSKSTLKDAKVEEQLKDQLNGKTLAQVFDEIIAETWEEFFGSDKKTGRFETDLKPSDIANKSAFEIKNVKYAEMTANNMNDYFKPAITEINKGN